MRSEKPTNPPLVPTPAFITEATVTEGFKRLASALVEELRGIVASAQADERVAYLVFDLSPAYVFGGFPITAWTFDSEGQEVESSIHNHDLLAGKHLLDPRGDYPLGRADWLGFDTMPDIALVERVMVQQFQQCWALVAGDKLRFDAFIGVWIANLEYAAESEPCPMLNLATGEQRVLDFLWEEWPG